MKIENYKLKIILLLIIIGIFFRFYNLNWGSPFYFHPDERNIASAVSQLQFPQNLNPHFFAYGSFPIYIIYIVGVFYNLFSHFPAFAVSFEQAILISRFFSAILSVALIPMVYLIGKQIKDNTTGLLAAFLTVTSIGLIQFAHFGTFEILLTFLGVLLFYFSIKRNLVFTGIILGLLLATKVSSIVLLPIPILSFLLYLGKNKKIRIYKITTNILTFCAATLTAFIITSPFVLIDFPSFIASMRYESSVAFGSLPVFYTGEFFNTVPVLFQFLHIYPFILNPILTILFIPSLLYVSRGALQKKNDFYLLLIVSYLLLFFSQSFLFAKWTRYMVPGLPFMYLIIAIGIKDWLNRQGRYLMLGIILFVSALFTIAYFITVHAKPDTRITAGLWAGENIPSNSKILSEVYDLGITPFNPYFSNIKLFNFYDELLPITNNYDYIILTSQRLLKTRLTKKIKFPQGNKFYDSLLNGALRFKKVYETPCDIFCKITYLGDPVFSLEETANVFDRPTVFVFKKLKE